MADNGTIGRVQTMMCMKPPPEIPPGTPEMRAIDPEVEKRQARASSDLAIALLGPVFGAPAVYARAAGAPVEVVDNFSRIGLDLAGTVALKGTGGGRVLEPAAPTSRMTMEARPSATRPAKRSNGVAIKKSGPKHPPGTRTAEAEVKDLSQFNGKSKADIEAELQQEGYTKVPSNDGTGSVWTKPGSDGNTAAVRIDDATVRPNPKGFADEVPHAHKEVVPTSEVSNGNYGNASSKYNDSGTAMTGKGPQIARDVHIPIKWP